MEEDNITNIEEKFNDVSDNKETDMKRSKSYWNLLEELNKPIFKKNVEEKEESNDQKTLVQLIEKDRKENKDDKACHICYKVEESKIPQKVKMFWKVLTKIEETIIGKIKELLRMLRYKKCTKYREKSLVRIIRIILDKCVINKNIEENNERISFMLNKIKGSSKFILHRYILNDKKLDRRFQVFWEWYKEKTLANKIENNTMMRFKQLIIKKDDIITSKREVKKIYRKYKIYKNHAEKE
ncbi:hypothetical protein GLOIN_2v1886091 [Rhizophagus clarus]|uniref:Uncharacterized protein n=1 Tax=Rhizophagus clarus TaxID=94130 RepID=A0A8H3LQZ3_9GLOM|nr:hypothetical protein GLOIN_2v1886091 [Rhizophagus clarus]